MTQHKSPPYPRNTLYKYNPDWDKKLNWLMDNADKVKTTNEHTLTFYVKSGSRFMGLFVSYDAYEVWVVNKNSSYGYLFRFNGEFVKGKLQYSPSQQTIDRLFKLETSIYSSRDYNYIYGVPNDK